MHILQVRCSTQLKAIILKKDTSELEKELPKWENFILLHGGAQIKIKSKLNFIRNIFCKNKL